jgi:hypothetical protein
MNMASPPAPRTFAGKRDAPVLDFMESFVHKVAKLSGQSKSPMMKKAKALSCGVAVLGATDLGSFMRMQSDAIKRKLEEADAPEEWAESIEEHLQFSFGAPPLPSQGDEEAKAPRKQQKFSRYADDEALAPGASLLSQGVLQDIKFSYDDFSLHTAHPRYMPISEMEYVHILDTVVTKLFADRGIVHWDSVLRTHVGDQLEVLFPKKPDKGAILGTNRQWAKSLKWRASNARKTASQVRCSRAPRSPRPCTLGAPGTPWVLPEVAPPSLAACCQ